MSWQSYVDDHLMCALPHGGQLTSAAIVGQDGGVWAQSAGFPAITKAEVDAIMAGLGDAAAIAATGIVIGGQKFLSIGGEPGAVLRGKKNTDGITIKKTEGALVVGIYGKDVAAGEANTVVENLADYLKGQGI